MAAPTLSRGPFFQARDIALGPAGDEKGFPKPFGGTEGGTGGAGLPSGNGSSSSGSRGGGGKRKGKRGAGGGVDGSSMQRAVKRRDHWANQLCTPEWMLTVPSDLNGAGSSVGAGEPSVRLIE